MDQSSAIDSPRFAVFQRRLVQALPRLRGFALSYCGARADAEDAVQSTCERALKRWQQWNGRGALEHWLLKILVNAWRDEKRYRQVRAPAGDAAFDWQENPGAGAETALYLEQVRGEIMRLPDGQREVLVLVAGQGLSYKEAAELLNIPLGTVMSRLARARRTLIAILGDGNA